MPLHIAVDLVFFTGRKGGSESYVRGMFPAMAAAHDDLRFVGIGNRELAENPPDWFPGEIVPLPVSGENRVTWALAEAFAVAVQARRIKADLLHCPSNFGPSVKLLPTLVSILDVLPIKHPEWVPGGRARGVQLLSRATARAATRIHTISEASADDIVELLGRPRSDIDMIYLGADPVDAPLRGERTGRPYVLAGGNRMPHKNHARLLEAWALIPEAERPRLVVTGSHGDDPLTPLLRRLGLEDDVELRGWVTAEELADLYEGASAFAFPTLFEGFGLPVVEAMVRGCPVIGSDLPVLREVGGDDMVYIDPYDTRSIADAVRRVVSDQALRESLSAAGLKRASLFTWQRTADAHAEVYRAMARNR
ncbi:glycosyltransferase family 4 protein [Actinosynnema sp. CS-041913]|uniref:glycosyltransferase family 4 protein n=1 Tax=Actinosynnema sp. CS-041913 TaxID=3239917 RepID=UPI003D8E4D04